MANNLIGYEYYVKKCEQYGLDPLNYRSFISNLTKEQLFLLVKKANNEYDFYDYSLNVV